MSPFEDKLRASWLRKTGFMVAAMPYSKQGDLDLVFPKTSLLEYDPRLLLHKNPHKIASP